MIEPARVRAPELSGAGGWVGGEGPPLAELRGRIVLLDFLTSGCVNCIRVIEELRALERRYAGELVVLGVHSPKFPHEQDHATVAAMVARHRIEHPVLDDAALAMWDAYAVRAWPTLVLIDARGRIAATFSGEGHAAELDTAVATLIAEADAEGTLRPGDPVGAGEMQGTGELAFPAKVAVGAAADGSPRLAIADTGHDRVLVCALDGEVLEEHGGFYQPGAVRFDGPGALLVCETGADRVWSVATGPAGARVLLAERIASPADVVRWRGHVVIAESGRHRLLAIDEAGELQVIAGTGAEGLLDGPGPGHPGAAAAAAEGKLAVLAQPSGLAAAGADLVFADAEASALRLFGGGTQEVRTVVGEGLFSWGARDGEGDLAQLQQPLGVAVAPDEAVYVADTYNNLVRVLRGGHLWTVPVEGFLEPGGLDVLPDGRLVVADTGNHRIVLVDPVAATAEVVDVGRPASSDVVAARLEAVAETIVAPPGTTVKVRLDLDGGGWAALAGAEELDAGERAPVQVRAIADDPALLRGERSWEARSLPVDVELELGEGAGRVTLELRAATCGEGVCRLRSTQRAYDVLLRE